MKNNGKLSASSADIHWASKNEIQDLIHAHKFSEIDLLAILMFLRDEYESSTHNI